VGGEGFLQSLLDAGPDSKILVDDQGRIVFVHEHSAALFGYTAHQLLESTVEDLLPVDLRLAYKAHRTRYLAAPAVRSMGSGLLLRARRADGTEFPVEVNLSPVHIGDELFTVAAIRDISERVLADENLHRRQEAVRDVEQGVALADDRQRIARDLHDTVIQRLFGTGLNLQAAMATADERTRVRIETTITDLDETIKELRTAIFSLQGPSSSAPGGVRGRCLDVIRASRPGLGFEPRLQFDGPIETMDDAIVDQLVPTLREALANVARHAHARGVRITITVAETVTLSVTDDGTGEPDRDGPGRGLTNMTERATRLGGTFEVAHPSSTGTRILWRVPSDQLQPFVDPAA